MSNELFGVFLSAIIALVTALITTVLTLRRQKSSDHISVVTTRRHEWRLSVRERAIEYIGISQQIIMDIQHNTTDSISKLARLIELHGELIALFEYPKVRTEIDKYMSALENCAYTCLINKKEQCTGLVDLIEIRNKINDNFSDIIHREWERIIEETSKGSRSRLSESERILRYPFPIEFESYL